MARDEQQSKPPLPACVATPQVSLVGEVNQRMVETFLDQIEGAIRSEGDVAIEITTPGGDAELARRMVLEVAIARTRVQGRLVFVGKTQIYSAGVTLMSAFPKEDRYLTRDSVLLIHCRQLDKTIEISGPMRSSLPKLHAVIQQVETGIRLEEENFRRLIRGSDLALDELCEKGLHNWYLTADEALELRLVEALI